MNAAIEHRRPVYEGTGAWGVPARALRSQADAAAPSAAAPHTRPGMVPARPAGRDTGAPAPDTRR